MNGLERILAAVRFEPSDRIPVVAQIFGHAAMVEKVSLESYLTNPAVLARCQLAALERYGADAVFAMLDANVETEALGSRLRFSENRYPSVERYALDAPSIARELEIPDPRLAGRMPVALEAVRILRQQVKDEVLVAGCALGPMTLCCQLLGIERLLYLSVDEPDAFERLLDFATNVALSFGGAQIEAGAHLCLVFDPSASPEVVPPAFFGKMLLPRLRRLLDGLKGRGACASWLHIAGPVDPLLAMYPSCAAEIGNVDYCVDLERARALAPRLCLNGNIRPLAFVDSTAEEIATACERALTLGRGGGFILSSGCEIPLEARPECVEALVQLGPGGSLLTVLLRARHEGRTVTIACRPGATLRESLDATDLRVRSGCNGNGSCGLCRVRLLSGEASGVTDLEKLYLGAPLLRSGVRLACRTFPLADMELEVLNVAPRAVWRSILPASLDSPCCPAATGSLAEPPIATRVALDIGTTNLCITLFGSSGHRLCARRGQNPQARFGADVVTRLEGAREKAVGDELERVVEQAVASALLDIALCEGISVDPCATALAVGNTAMLSLLRGSDGGLLDPSTWTRAISWPSTKPKRFRLGASRELAVNLVEPLGGFVGSDLLAGVVAANLLEGESPALLVDFGTNTEIALWDGETLWVTSAAGGPAFEASGLRCGVPADVGAISRVRPGEPLEFEVIGGGEPQGVCGSGLVDWIACLLSSGALSPRGGFKRGDGPPSLGGPERRIMLLKSDVDVFQRAKAAIGAGVLVLMGRAQVTCSKLRRVVTTGLFGRALDVSNAQAIGLLPRIPRAHVETYDNLALAGCEILLLSAGSGDAVESVRARTSLVNLARCDDFEEQFVKGLFLEPMEDR